MKILAKRGKTKVTKSDVWNRSDEVFFCNENQLSHFLARLGDPYGYNSGTYGWNWDAYLVSSDETYNVFTVVRGNRNMFGTRIPSSLCNEFERKTEEVYHNGDLGYDEQDAMFFGEIVEEFCRELSKL